MASSSAEKKTSVVSKVISVLLLLASIGLVIWGLTTLTSVAKHLIDVLCLALFFGGMWLCGEIFILCGSPLIGYIVCGIVLGPEVLNVVPEPKAFELFGSIGVMLLLCEAGLHMNLLQVLKSGKTAAWLTLLGMGVPWFGGTAVMAAFGFPYFAGLSGGACFAPTSVGMATKILVEFGELESVTGQMCITIAMVDDVLSLIVLAILVKLGESASGDAAAHLLGYAGATSYGATSYGGGNFLSGLASPSSSLLGAGGELVKKNASAATGEIKLPEGPALAKIIVQPILFSLCFMIIGVYFTFAIPILHKKIVDSNKSKGNANLKAKVADIRARGGDPDTVDLEIREARQTTMLKHTRFVVLFTIAFIMLYGLAFGIPCGLLSTELLGVFMAGVAFAEVREAKECWHHYLRPITTWLARLFFAAKIGFAVPVSTMMSGTAFGQGLALSFPSTFGKVFTGLLVPAMDQCLKKCNPDSKWEPTSWGEGWKIGWGRVGRGEFAFYMAQVGYFSGLMDSRTYSCVVWALLISSFTFPFAFRATMNYFKKMSKLRLMRLPPSLRHKAA